MNINVRSFRNKDGGNDYVALFDSWKMRRIYPNTLEAGGIINSKLNGVEVGFFDLLSSSHPLPEPGTDNQITFLISSMKMQLHIVRIQTTEDREIIATIQLSEIPYIHSFSVTQTHVLLIVHPYFINFACMAYKSPVDCMRWSGHKDAYIYAVELTTGNIIVVSTDSVFVFHHINAYNLDKHSREIIMDVVAYPNANLIDDFKLENLRRTNEYISLSCIPTMKRYKVNLDTKIAEQVSLNVRNNSIVNNFDFPIINEAYRNKQYCYIYGIGYEEVANGYYRFMVVKRDVCEKNRDLVWNVTNHNPSEPFFLQRPNENAEDDGILLVVMLDSEKEFSYLAILNATTMSLHSKSDLPIRQPMGIHRQFFPEVF